MPAPGDRDIVRLKQIIDLIDIVRGDLRDVDQATFLTDKTLIEATAYRIGSIGEYASKLAPERKDRHPSVAWQRAYDMRNVLFHDYDGVIPGLLWEVITSHLTLLEEACRAELVLGPATPDSPAASP